MISQFDSIGKGFHRESVFFHSREVEELSRGSQGKNDLVIREFVGVFIKSVLNRNPLVVQVDLEHPALVEGDAAKKFPNWINNVGWIQFACGDLMKHRGEQKEVLSADQRHVDICVLRKILFQLKRGV